MSGIVVGSLFSALTSFLKYIADPMNKMPGQVFCLLGPNGSGKSTLLKCIMQLLTPAAGRVVTVGKEVNRKICIPVLRENTGPSLAKEVS